MTPDINIAPRAWAEIDLEAARNNYRTLRKAAGGAKMMCVIKGDAHGHGAVPLGKALAEEGADAFGVAALSEGIALRKAGIEQPVLVLGWTPAQLADQLVSYRLTQSILDEAYANELNAACEGPDAPLDVHIKLDTGMTRTGIFAQKDHKKAAEAVCRIDQLPNLRITGIFTHFAVADVPEKDGFTEWQRGNFCAVLDEMKKLGFDKDIVRHASNSAGILFHPDCRFDMVRAGVALYGFDPTNGEDGVEGITPILTLKTHVAQVKDIPKGAKISYGCIYEAPRDMTVAVAAAGYADSYPRALSGKGAWAVINGQKAPQVGRICMDMCMFDVTGLDVRRGDEVILYGNGGMTLEQITNLTGGINCETTSLLTNRVARIYK